MAGIDEAGRGPVIGSMFVAIVVMDENDLNKLVKLGLTDSKKLTPRKRKTLYKLILTRAKYVSVKEVKPDEIDKSNINLITLEVAKELIMDALKKVKFDIVYVDAIGKVRRIDGMGVPIIIEPKADQVYPIVSAASIVAKEFRERHVRDLKRKYGDFGSGYPSDPKTIKWLEQNYDKPIVRKKWKTLSRIRYNSSKEGVGGSNHDHSTEGEGRGDRSQESLS